MKQINPFYGFNRKNYCLRAIVFALNSLLRIFKNIIPLKFKISSKLILFQKYVNLFTHNYQTIPNYCKEKNIPFDTIETEVGKIYTIRNFYIDILRFSSVIHDNHNTVFLESVLHKGNVDVWEICYASGIKFNKSKHIQYIDEAVDLSLQWFYNYWHFTFQVLDKVMYLEKNGYKGKYLAFDRPFIRQLLELLGISEDRIIFVDNKERYQIGKLHVIDYFWKSYTPLIIETKNKILSKIGLYDSSKYPKKLYIRRTGNYARQVTNENEVIELLQKYGFELFNPDNYPVEEQIKYFNSADIIVSPHGGCSTNALYMKSNSHFVECFSYTWLNPCMFNIIKPNNMYYHMVCESEKKDFRNLKGEKRLRNYEINLSCLDDIIYKFI